ncbi:glycoside hydrolase family 43 protein [Mycoplasmatota bacterium]|nr:glycoside hydrolase family 43 protein [Mycoplasmatota bacterium]
MRNIVGLTGIGDPYIIRFKDTYYLYATTFRKIGGTIDGFNCWYSTDMINWTLAGKAYEKNNRSFGDTDFWAPEVVYANGKYIMHYSARLNENNSLRIGVAYADRPEGPFIDVFDKKPMFDFGFAAIDGHVYFAEDGHIYFYYSKDCSENIFEGRHESHIYVVELDKTLTKFMTTPKIVIKPEQDWEAVTGDWRWTEGPFVVKDNDLYYMMYSAGFYYAPTYSIGYAVSDSPLGPFKKSENNPLIKSIDKVISGPGHNSVFTDMDNNLYMAYHIHTDMNNPSEDRQLVIDRLYIEDQKLWLSEDFKKEEK